jgi:hypothetical protein
MTFFQFGFNPHQKRKENHNDGEIHPFNYNQTLYANVGKNRSRD